MNIYIYIYIYRHFQGNFIDKGGNKFNLHTSKIGKIK